MSASGRRKALRAVVFSSIHDGYMLGQKHHGTPSWTSSRWSSSRREGGLTLGNGVAELFGVVRVVATDRDDLFGKEVSCRDSLSDDPRRLTFLPACLKLDIAFGMVLLKRYL